VRPETGPMQFGDDWPGVFVRGDNALHYALCLKVAINSIDEKDFIIKSHLKGLYNLLTSCLQHHQNFSEDEVQKARDWKDASGNNMMPVPNHWPPNYNASSEPCDMVKGPCSCGAWHSLSEDWVQYRVKEFGFDKIDKSDV